MKRVGRLRSKSRDRVVEKEVGKLTSRVGSSNIIFFNGLGDTTCLLRKSQFPVSISKVLR